MKPRPSSPQPLNRYINQIIKPSRVALLPCLFVVLLWFLLPRPHMPETPELDPYTRSLMLKAISNDVKRTRFNLHSDTIRSSDSSSSLPAVSNTVDQRSNVLIVSAVSPKKCPSEHGDYINLLATKNKQDYARIHGYDFLLSTKLSDERLSGAWNKVALIRDLLKTTKYEWIVWIDADALFMDIKFEIPFERYQFWDLVMWGQPKELYQLGDAHMGLNTGVLYVKNSEWSKRLFQEVAELGVGGGKTREAEMRSHLSKYDWALFDQNGFAYWLKQHASESRRRVYLETEYDINAYWKDMPMERLLSDNEGDGDEDRRSMFVKHFMGCQFCSGINSEESDKCIEDFYISWQLANERVDSHSI